MKKKANIVREMKKRSLNIYGLSEDKWKKNRYCYLSIYRMDIVLSALVEEEESME